MSQDHEFPTIAFVWHHEHISSSVVEAARRTGSRAVFDLTSSNPDKAVAALLQAGADQRTVDLKLDAPSLLDPEWDSVLEETGISNVWTELHPVLLGNQLPQVLERVSGLSQRINLIPIVGDVHLLETLINDHSEVRTVTIKGSEASGFVSTENTFALYGSMRDRVRAGEAYTRIAVWGGVATPEAAAAFISAGAAGIVFESVHWLTDLAGLGETTNGKLRRLRPEHTDLVGLNLQTPCRLYNKGNSAAVKALREFAGSLCGAEIREEQRSFFAERIRNERVSPLTSSYGRDELIPIGVEAAFAEAFVKRFGPSTEQAIELFITEIERSCSQAGDTAKAFVQSPAAQEMGTAYPILQGAMSWITDVPAFARNVAEAGALPTVALGMMSREILDDKLGNLGAVMGDLPYAVNVITLQENPYRDEQLAWIKAMRPRFAVIAAGEPSHARELMEVGIEPMYIAPNEELLRMAIESGIRWVICEGNEAGGHVGEHSTITIAQMILELKHREPERFHGTRVILAGGICNRETAFMAAMLGANAVQIGTAYLATEEIVATGALTDLYRTMIVEADAGATVITGEATGLRVRSLKSARMDAICDLERDFAAGSEDESSFRQKIEHLSAGSLFVAARGLDKPGGSPLAKDECMNRGQFMSGACAGSVNGVRTVRELHEELATGNFQDGIPYSGPIREPKGGEADRDFTGAPHSAIPPAKRSVTRAPERERLAITGMSVVNSLGNSPAEVWSASKSLLSGVAPVPASRWNHELYYDSRPRAPEKTYCKVGAFQHLEISRKELGIPPQDFRTMTDSTRVTMWLAKHAIEESGILDSGIPPERIGVLISQNSGEAAATLQDVIIRAAINDIVRSVNDVVPLNEETVLAVQEAVKAGRIAVDDTTLVGRLNCSAAGFICNKYGFMGPSYAVSAACSTALVAMYSAYQMIRNGIIDAAVVGGAEEPLTPMHFLEFSAIGVLAGLSGTDRPPAEASRPFDRERDGMVLGEGGGMVVIERESIAAKRGARVHGYITAMGASNNNLGIVESSAATQEIAIRSAFDDAPYGPDAVDLVECHATSTQQGDVEEVHALRNFYGPEARVTLTSFKSQIGHTLGASGVNSLVRGITAMKDGVFPPTLNYSSPDPEIDLEASGLIIHALPEDWKRSNGHPRRFQVNAFGFGGSNYVLHVEEAIEQDDTVLAMPSTANVRGHTQDPAPPPAPKVSVEPPGGVSFLTTRIGDTSYRLGVVADSDQQAESLIKQAEPVTNGGPLPPKRIRALSRQGIFLGNERAPTEPLAFVFPGQGSHYAGMGHELYQTFPVIREWMDNIAEVADFDILDLLFHNAEEDLQKTRWQQPALFTLEYAMVKYLHSLGVRPVALAGHSLGELTALCLAGVYSYADGFRIVNKRARCMDKACDMNTDPGIMMAVDAPLDYLKQKLESWPNVYVTNINSPQQIVLGGDTNAVRELGEELKSQGYRRTQLRVSMAFHSPIMRCIRDELQAFVDTIEFHAPQIPVISNTTMQPFPADPTEIKRIVMAHLESPVHWMQNVQTMWDDYGVRVFVEVGPRDILSNMIRDIHEESTCIQTSLPSAENEIFRSALMQLYAKGNLPSPKPAKFCSFPGRPATTGPSPVQARTPEPSSTGPSPAPTSGGLERIIQREINAFVVESFGRFLKPLLLAAIRREHDPSFGEDRLDGMLREMFPQASIPAGPGSYQTPAAVPVHQVSPVPVAPARDEQASGAPASSAAEPHADQTAKPADVTESVIAIIMDATGYEREEIEPDMDLREDLSIRSSRLPVIMDSLESYFSIKVDLEEFMDVRTIKDIADKISSILDSQKKDQPAPKSGNPVAPAGRVSTPATDIPAIETGDADLKRLVFREIPLPEGTFQPLEFDSMDGVVVLAPGSGTDFRKTIGAILRRDYGTNPLLLSYLPDELDGENSFDLRSPEGTDGLVTAVSELESLAGLVILVDDLYQSNVSSERDAATVLTGLYRVVKALLESPAKRFCLSVHREQTSSDAGHILAQGLLGIMLSAAHEFASVQFRSIHLDDQTDLSAAIRGGLDKSRKYLEILYRKGEAYTRAGRVAPVAYTPDRPVELNPGDVVVLSGGAQGVTYSLARALGSMGCSVVLLGRTLLDTDIDLLNLAGLEGDSSQLVRSALADAGLELQDDQLEKRVASSAKALDIVRNVEALRGGGVDASYYLCDVMDKDRTEQVMQQIAARYGRIDGIVHGAGVLKDAFVKDLSAEDFASVVAVKFLGAMNLLEAADSNGLKLFVGLSSGASIQGNPGQSNYAAGNRMMSALIHNLAGRKPDLVCKALMLPPIEGAGMAEDPEIRSLMKRMNASYVHLDELASLFVRELALAPKDDTWVLFMRSLPQLQTVDLETTSPAAPEEMIPAGSVVYPAAAFPLVDSVTHMDLKHGHLVANRAFSQTKDTWLADHKPFKFLKYPLVSAIMAVETFMEAAKILYPHLPVTAVRDVRFLDMVECPPGVERLSEIRCQTVQSGERSTRCDMTLLTREISPSGRLTDRTYPNYRAQILLGDDDYVEPTDLEGFPIDHQAFDRRPMSNEESHQWYDSRTDLKGRYRVIEELYGASPDSVRGHTIYREQRDFTHFHNTSYQGSPYLLEALMQTANFFVIMRDTGEGRSMIPFRIGEVRLLRKARDNEKIIVEARKIDENKEGLTWNARATDLEGNVLMFTRDMVMRWFTG